MCAPHLIQQNDLRFFQDSPSDRHPLLLPAAQFQASLADVCVVSCRNTPASGELGLSDRSGCSSASLAPSSTLTHPSLTLWQLQDPAVDVGGRGGPLHLLPAGCNATVQDVVADGVVEKDRILGNDADVGPQRRLAHLGRRKRPKPRRVVRGRHLKASPVVPAERNTNYASRCSECPQISDIFAMNCTDLHPNILELPPAHPYAIHTYI